MDDRCPSLRNFILEDVNEKEDSWYDEAETVPKAAGWLCRAETGWGEHTTMCPGALSWGQVLLL